MDSEKPINKETIWESWLAEFQGQWWLNPEAMPNGVYDVVQKYIHWQAHSHRQESSGQMAEAAKGFRELTGYDLEEFMEYYNKKG